MTWRSLACVFAFGCSLVLLACSKSSDTADDSAAGGTPMGGSGTASNGGNANNGGAGGLARSGGAAGVGASSSGGGSSGGGASGTAGASGAGGAPLFGPIRCQPSTAGDGKHDLAAAGDPPEWTLKAGAVAGKVTEAQSFASTTYNLHFPYRVYTSANYVAGAPAIFLLFGDGAQFLADFHAATVLDNLTASHDLPPTVALFIDPPSDGDRVQTYDPPTVKYTNFLFNEILPSVIFGKYSVSRDPEAWSLVGYSASGGQGWEVLWNRPDDFHKFIGDNTSFGAAITYQVDWVAVIKAAPARTLRVSLLTSTNDLSDQRGIWYVINQNVAADLAAKGNQWRLMIGTGQHYPPLDGEHDFPNALRWMFQGCSF